ncbi:hypothetical protein G3I26_23125, partial [Streptomyces sp. SID7909]|nr:hypothetical protein [Streptomyces sp. SID7909]
HQVTLRDRSAGAWLEVLPPSVERLVIVGDAPWHTDRDTTMTYDVTEWLTAPLPEGWTHGRHYSHERYPVGRFHTANRRAVEIQHLGSWVPGTTCAEPDTAWNAFEVMRSALRARWGSTVQVLGSPKSLGEDLWLRTIPKGTEYPLMSQELRELIKTTSGQGRFELFTPPAV